MFSLFLSVLLIVFLLYSSFGNFKLLKLIPSLKRVSEKFEQTSKGFSDSQIKFEIKTYKDDNLPKELINMKAIKPGSRN